MPDWHCPYCQKGFLGFDPLFNPAIVHTQETPESEEGQNRQGFSLHDIDMNFTAALTCNRCRRMTYCLGKAGLDPIYDVDPYEPEWETIYLPRVFMPAIQLFYIPSDCPSDVKESIQSSFALAWLDLSATGNKLRIAVEQLLLHIDPSLQQYGKLHKRLEVLGKSRPEITSLLFAIKWLGNDASHKSSLLECDIAVAYKIIEKVLDQLYPSASTNISALAQLVNSTEGSPVK